MCTVARSKRNIYILFSWTSLFLFFYSFYQIWSFIHSHSHSLSLVHLSFLSSSTLSTSSPSSSSLRYDTTCFFFFFFFFFHFIKSGLIHSLSFTVISHPKPLKLTLSTSPTGPLSTSSARSHSLNSDHRPTKLVANRSA